METEHCRPNGSAPRRRHCYHCLPAAVAGREAASAPQPALRTLLGTPRCSMLHLISVPSPFAEGTPLPSEAHLLLHPGGDTPSRVERDWSGPAPLLGHRVRFCKRREAQRANECGISARAARKEVPRLECAELSRPTDLEWILGGPAPP